MTIKEVEERTGLTRANVRFYENEGLLNPNRTENGYRDYSETDVETLQKIRLLRSIHMPLDAIKRVQSDHDSLPNALWQAMKELEREQKNTETEKKLCQLLRDDEVLYDSLNAEHYLDRMKHDIGLPPAEASADLIPPPYSAPWRRLFARQVDFILCSILWGSIVALFRNHMDFVDYLYLCLWNLLVAPALLFFLEPLLLSLTGTTPGKWLFGIRVLDEDGHKLSYSMAIYRLSLIYKYLLTPKFPYDPLGRVWMDMQDYLRGVELDWDYTCGTVAVFFAPLSFRKK